MTRNCIGMEPRAVASARILSRWRPFGGCVAGLFAVQLAAHADATDIKLPPLIDVSNLAAGGQHSCAVAASGTVSCWGDGSQGQLGNGQASVQLLPSRVASETAGYVAVATGLGHSCAIDGAGQIGCWGSNSSGQLGNGSVASSSRPVPVSGLLAPAIAVGLGDSHSCALLSSNQIQCWGANNRGQLGSMGGDSSTPRLVQGATYASMAVGATHTCALTISGSVLCWGRNSDGQLGDGSTAERPTPVAVFGLSTGVSAIAAGYYHSCALKTNGIIACWGRNAFGQLGRGGTAPSTIPVDVSGLPLTAAQISLGGESTCALLQDGGLRCWGENTHGQLGDGTEFHRDLPQAVSAPATSFSSVSVGGTHTCARSTAGSALCWGNNSVGQLGGGTSSLKRELPSPVHSLTQGIDDIVTGLNHSCAISRSGALRCWGSNVEGQLGDGTRTSRGIAAPVTALPAPAHQVVIGDYHTCALVETGSVHCWGGNARGELGQAAPASSAAPLQVPGLPEPVARIAAGSSHTCAVGSSGAVRCWGRNSDGQLGDGTALQRTGPVSVLGLAFAPASLSAGYYHTCAASAAGGVVCWGNNDHGQLGDGSTSPKFSPTPVAALPAPAATLSLGGSHSCALLTTGAVACWGLNQDGQLADGTTTSRSVPTPAVGVPSPTSLVAAGAYHTCASGTQGNRCWGRGVEGQLGIAGSPGSSPPAIVQALGSSNLVSLDAGDRQTCAVAAAGGAFCWGDDRYGQLGVDAASSRIPAQVLVRDDNRAIQRIAQISDSDSVGAIPNASGRFAVLTSPSAIIGAADTNQFRDVFRRDLQSGELILVSVDDAGAQLLGDAQSPDISADGSRVVFVAPEAAVRKVSKQSNAKSTGGVSNTGLAAFLRNIQTGTTHRIASVGLGSTSKPRISANGQTIVFSAPVADALTGQVGQENVFLVTVAGNDAGETVGPPRCVSCTSNSIIGVPAGFSDGTSVDAVVSADGTLLAYATTAKNQIASNPSPCQSATTQEVIFRNIQTGMTRRISPPASLPPANCSVMGSNAPTMDYSGLNIAFQSDQGLKPGALPGRVDVFLSEGASAASLRRVSEQIGGAAPNAASRDPRISGDGRSIAFVSSATDLDPGGADQNGVADPFLWRQGQIRERLATSRFGAETNAPAEGIAISYAGALLVVESEASNLVEIQPETSAEVYIRTVPSARAGVYFSGFE